jgi:hypothetical protein
MKKISSLFCLSIMIAVFSSCNYKRKVDLILYNGIIYTVDESFNTPKQLLFAMELLNL